MFQSILEDIIGFFLPASCLGCDAPITPQEKHLCADCTAKLEKYSENHPWKDEMVSSGVINNSLSALWFREDTAIQVLLHAMKYQKMKSVGIMLGEVLGREITGLNGLKFDLVIPVPLHKAKLRERTYNQSEYIARGVSGVTGARALNDGLIRTRFTGTQTKLNRTERKENVLGAFSINPKHTGQIQGKNIILVDDVITTGATILECAGVLRSSGAGKIWVTSAAYAELKSGNTQSVAGI